MHPSTARALENIDAAIFSGEMLHIPDDLAQLTLYFSRWAKAMAEDAHTEPTETTHTPTTKLVSMNMSGNLHDVARYVTQFGFADFFVQAECAGHNSLVLFRLPADWPTDKLGPVPADRQKPMPSLKLINGPGLTRHVYHSSCGRLRLILTIAQARYVSHPGDCLEEVCLLAAKPEVASQLAALDPEHVREYLVEADAWSDEELADDIANRLRFLWMAANSIADSPDETIDDEGF